MTDRDLLYGLEFDFVCSDDLGRIAVFSSAGYGPIPVESLADVEGQDRRVRSLDQLAVTSAARLGPAAKGDTSFWTAKSERGVYCFDWQIWHGPYRLVSAPIIPTTLAALGSDVVGVVRCPGSFAAMDDVLFKDLGIEVAR